MDCSMTGLPFPHHLPRLPKFMSIASVMPSSHLILWCPLLLLPSISPSIREFSNKFTVHIKWPKYWCFSILPSSEYSSSDYFFETYWLDLLSVQEYGHLSACVNLKVTLKMRMFLSLDKFQLPVNFIRRSWSCSQGPRMGLHLGLLSSPWGHFQAALAVSLSICFLFPIYKHPSDDAVFQVMSFPDVVSWCLYHTGYCFLASPCLCLGFRFFLYPQVIWFQVILHSARREIIGSFN